MANFAIKFRFLQIFEFYHLIFYEELELYTFYSMVHMEAFSIMKLNELDSGIYFVRQYPSF